jgi:WD40 repeat protein
VAFPIRSIFAVRVQVARCFIFAAALCLLPLRSLGQELLPIQWINSQIGQVERAAYSPDGTLMAVGGSGGVEISTLSTGAIAYLPTIASNGVTSVAFSPDSKTLAVSGGNDSGGVIELWNVSKGQLITTLDTAATYVISVAFSADGTMLTDGGEIYDATTMIDSGVLELWSVSSGVMLNTLATNATYVVSVAFSPDGKTICDGGGQFNYDAEAYTGVLELWNVSTGILIGSLHTAATYAIDSVAFSPDGQTLIDGGESYYDNTDIYSGVLETWSVSAVR